MPRDGREAQWRQLCEGDSPESVSKCRLPDNADEHYTALQRLLVVRCVELESLMVTNVNQICLGRDDV